MTQPPKWIIRTATQDDACSIASIYSESILARNATMVLDPVSYEKVSEQIRGLNERESIIVATTSHSLVVGWGIVKFYSDRPGYASACETSLFVDATYRNQGVGNAIQAELVQRARKAAFHHIVVKIWAQNQSSIVLHERHGFEMVGIQKEIGHVDQKWIDVAVMQCLL
ncbi:N-acetyltransferase family protein [bacterium]|nr:N-acetyltransferase family protein [bacterium]